ncbi:hypothetical protein PI125_g2008 [Phytophthora idaei]|nr:hypothetical protein PI125_g2008 [Phytophthora idaei]
MTSSYLPSYDAAQCTTQEADYERQNTGLCFFFVGCTGSSTSNATTPCPITSLPATNATSSYPVTSLLNDHPMPCNFPA